MTKGPWIDLRGRTAAVTGAASGIGRAAGSGTGRCWCHGAGAGPRRGGRPHVADAITEAGGSCTFQKLDVTSKADWQAVADWIADGWGSLDILVNSAGVVFTDRVGDEDLEIYRKTFAINVEGTLLGMRMALSFMRASGKGAIINISSSASFSGSSIMASYGARKATVAHFTRSAALETARAGYDIRINTIHPGLIQTSMADDFYDIYDRVGPPEAVEAVMTTGRAGRPEEVADLIVFLGSERATFISGAAIAIDRAKSA
jgi:NAD(P)-dependent dehydrogenase (short-subunit alcohol dehydrogenase family)